MTRAHPVRDSDRHPWVWALFLALLVFLWVGDCFGQEIPGPSGVPTLIETPYAPAGFAELLRDYVVRMPGKDGALETRFDYAAFHAEPGQEARRRDLFIRFVGVNPETMDPATRTAWAVNAYNFFVIDAVMEHFTDADGETLRSVADIGEKRFSVFDEERIPVGRGTYSLNRFENVFLFASIDRETGKSRGPVDPRLHFVIVCAAKGCPPLLPDPIHPEHLEKDLDEATRSALRSPRHLRLDGKMIHLSKIFEWYAADFTDRDVRSFLYKHGPPEVQALLAKPGDDVRFVTDIEWDWSLNRP